MQEVEGQSRAIDLLQAALAGGRLHHAFIFHGPAGVGKFTTAVALAKLLLCHDPVTDLTGRLEACGRCVSCKLLPGDATTASLGEDAGGAGGNASGGGSGGGGGTSGGGHPDCHIVTKELARYSDDAATRNRKLLNIPLDVLRQALLEPVYRIAQLGKRKVFIVDEAELIDGRGQNLLLKTLEEPPAGTHIILVTASEDKLLTTIRSRCHRVAFGPLPDEVIHRWLDQQMPDLSPADRQWMVRYVAGSLGQASLVRDYDLLAWARQVLPGVDQTVQGRPPHDLGAQITTFIDQMAQEWVKRHKNASKDAANRLAARLMSNMITQHARQALSNLASRLDPADPDAAQAVLSPWLNVMDSAVQAETALASHVNMGLVMDHLVSMMARPGRVSLARS